MVPALPQAPCLTNEAGPGYTRLRGLTLHMHRCRNSSVLTSKSSKNSRLRFLQPMLFEKWVEDKPQTANPQTENRQIRKPKPSFPHGHVRLQGEPGGQRRGWPRSWPPWGGSPRPAGAAPDLILVNTCTVTARADQQARQAIRRLARDYPGAAVWVTGCYAQRAAAGAGGPSRGPGGLGQPGKSPPGRYIQ